MTHIKNNAYTVPLLLILVLFGPFLAAIFLYLSSNEVMSLTPLSPGHVVQPPTPSINLSVSDLNEKVSSFKTIGWTLIYISKNCDSTCQVDLNSLATVAAQYDFLHTTFISTNEARTRYRSMLQAHYPQLSLLATTLPSLTRFLKNAGLSSMDMGFGLVDQQGNLILTYPPATSSRIILGDLQRWIPYNHHLQPI